MVLRTISSMRIHSILALIFLAINCLSSSGVAKSSSEDKKSKALGVQIKVSVLKDIRQIQPKKDPSLALKVGKSLDEGGGSDGGGNPEEMNTLAYPDEALLPALELAFKKIDKSSYSEKFLDNLKEELAALAQDHKFLLVDSLNIVSSSNTTNYVVSFTGKKYLSLDGITDLEISAPIYLAKKTLNYSVEKLAELVLHETLHHLFIQALAGDEDFISDLAQSLMAESQDVSLERALKYGIYIRQGIIKRSQLAFFLSNLYKKETGKVRENIEERLNEILPPQVQDMSLVELAQFLSDEIYSYNYRKSRDDMHASQVLFAIQKEMKGVEKMSPSDFYCGKKSKVTSWSKARCVDDSQRTLKEIF